MNSLATMYHYYWKERDKIVVQNVVGGFMGQNHSHSPEEFEEWKKQINPDYLVDMDKEEENDKI